jgi:hypothetical protein
MQRREQRPNPRPLEQNWPHLPANSAARACQDFFVRAHTIFWRDEIALFWGAGRVGPPSGPSVLVAFNLRPNLKAGRLGDATLPVPTGFEICRYGRRVTSPPFRTMFAR